MTEKGKQYKLDVHFKESERIVKRLNNQKTIIDDLFQSRSVEMMNRELAKLDSIHQSLLETYARVREIIQMEDEGEESQENTRMDELVKVVDMQDTEVFQTKKTASEWLISQSQAEGEGSVVSKRSGRSVKSVKSQGSKRSRSGGSRRDGSADSRGSRRDGSADSRGSEKSVKSNCSRTSNVSRTSKKAKLAGLQAQVDVLKAEGELEINEQVKAMKLETELFEREQRAALQAEIANKEAMLAQESSGDTRVAEMIHRDMTSAANRLKEEHITAEQLRIELLDKGEKIVKHEFPERTDKECTANESRIQKGCPTEETSQDITRAMVQLIKSQAAPKVDIDVFRGDPLEYIYFVANFKDMVESVVEDQRGRLNRLIQYTSGEAKDLIRHCVHNNSAHCYDDALSLLEREYGDPLRIASSYMDKLKNWPIIKHGDGHGYKSLYRFLLQCQAYQKNGCLDGLDSPLMIRNIQLKLPVSGQDKWAHVVGKIRKRTKKEAAFKDFVEFIEAESLVLNDPIYSRSQRIEKSDREKESERLRAYVTREEPAPIPPQELKCPLCDGKHDLDDCEQFMNMDVKDRKQYVFTNKLCFLCFGLGHRAKDCQQKKTCKVCSKSHPSSLHVTRTLAVGNHAGSGMCVIPVRLRHKDHPNENLLVYALLDECSQGTFISEDVLMRFDAAAKTARTLGTHTLHGMETIECLTASGFSVTCSTKHASVNQVEDCSVQLPVVYSQKELPFDRNDVPSEEYLAQWDHLSRVNESLREQGDIPVGLLIGRNCPLSLEPLEVIPSQGPSPYAYRTRLGWLVGDAADRSSDIPESTVKVNFNRCFWPAKDIVTGQSSRVCFNVINEIRDLDLEQSLKRAWESDTTEENSEMMALSFEDRRFLEIMKTNIRMVDGHYELPLPFRKDEPQMPCNRNQAVKRINSVKKRMLKDPSFHAEYTNFMMKFIDSGFARVAEPSNEPGWYLFHHAVFHPTKKKIRVVFDCTAETDGISLNSQLLQGPDLTNQMVGVFLRFRKEQVPIIGDLESMYCQVRVPEHQRKYLRFLFWPNGNLEEELISYEMCVHVFGAISSMGCVNYALHKTADDNEEEFGHVAAETLRDEFYVDDMATSVKNNKDAIELIQSTSNMCKAGGFNLTKIMCNSAEVMETVPVEKRSEVSKTFDLQGGPTVERPLGVQWTIENDTLGFNITFKSGALTRRGILATISGIYDLLGIASPFLLKGRKILQEITGEKVSWDADVDAKHLNAWNIWKEEISLIQNLSFPRCYKPPSFGEVVDVSLHLFGDGCKVGYGAACYVRQVDQDERVSVALVMGKSRVSPLKMITIPRLELTAATVAVKLGALVKGELKVENVKMFYYTDSTVTLGYICNDVRRFRVFVANRHQLIRSYSEKEEWRHVDTKENPADDASRGLAMGQEDKVKRWLNGPEFLYTQLQNDESAISSDIPEDDPEVIKTVNSCAVEPETILNVLERRISRWMRIKRVMAAVLLFVKRIKERITKKPLKCKQKFTEVQLRAAEKDIMDQVNVEDLTEAENLIIKMSQKEHFKHEINELSSQSASDKPKLRKKSLKRIYKLDPYIDDEGLLRVGGRLRNSTENDRLRFPMILPRKSLISQRIVEHYHRSMQHGGRSSTVNEIRSNGFWIIGISGMVRSLIYHCVGCRLQRGSMGCQKMADLPTDRTSCEPPFTYCGVDMFGPFLVKEGRKVLKRYCALFTCLSSRGVHIEVTASMDTDSFIQALRRFVARRGSVRTIRSDNGGNFVGTDNEMTKAWREMDQSKISDHLRENNCDWIAWERNVPVASHMGGVWERQIRTVRSVLNSMFKAHARPLDNESFSTLMAEVEAIVNSRPLTLEDINDPESMPLTPNHLLTLKSKIVMPPPGAFESADLYSRKRWRVVQHLANTFWVRWKKEYLQTLQARTKWSDKKRNFEIGDVVLLKDEDSVRNSWPRAVVVNTFPGDDGLVRTVEVKIASGSIMKRPIVKIVLLVEACSKQG